MVKIAFRLGMRLKCILVYKRLHSKLTDNLSCLTRLELRYFKGRVGRVLMVGLVRAINWLNTMIT